MWCEKCHNGSSFAKKGRCSMCGYEMSLSKSPFPDKPTRMGSKGANKQKKTKREKSDE